MSAVVIALLGASGATGAASDAAYNNSKILEFMNAERQARGVRSVGRDAALDRKAQEWANKLAAEGRMYHSSCCAGMAVGYRSGAQNLAYHDDSLSAAQAHNMWMASGVHRKNMLDPDFSNVGIAVACSDRSGRAYVVAVVEFGGDGNPSSSTPPRNPQVAGGSGNSRAMSCDGGVTAAAQPEVTTTVAKAAAVTQGSTAAAAPTTSTAVRSTRSAASSSTAVSTTRKTAASSTTTTKPPTTATDEARSTSAPVVAANVAPPTSAPPTAPPQSINADLAAARSSKAPAFWSIGLSAIAGILLLTQFRRGRRPAHAPKHSMRRPRG